jgi:transmembrane sensor
MDRKEVWELILKELSGDLTAEEQAQLEIWVAAAPANRLWYDQMRDPENINWFLSTMKVDDEIVNQSWEWIEVKRKSNRGRLVKPWLFYTKYGLVSAAAVVIIFSAPMIFQKKTNKSSSVVRDIAPGGNHATLTLGNGQILVLDSTHSGMIAEQAGTKIVKIDSGQIAYNQPSAEQAVLWNTIAVPRGGQYRLTLADGSRVVLNSGSSLQFPSSFAGRERRVILKGEGYFEVVHNPGLPFRVALPEQDSMEVAVLGTSFDVMAYPDEGQVKTTLLDGSVRVTNAGKSAVLNPDQVALTGKNGSLTVTPADTTARGNAAWAIGGMFYFSHADLKAIMRQISRWYSVDVEYGAGEFPKATFSGFIGRDKSLAVVMDVLRFYGIELKYEINGRKITVQP